MPVSQKYSQCMHKALHYHKIMRNFPKIIRKVCKIMQKFSDKKWILAIYHGIYAFRDKGQNCHLLFFRNREKYFALSLKLFRYCNLLACNYKFILLLREIRCYCMPFCQFYFFLLNTKNIYYYFENISIYYRETSLSFFFFLVIKFFFTLTLTMIPFGLHFISLPTPTNFKEA